MLFLSGESRYSGGVSLQPRLLHAIASGAKGAVFNNKPSLHELSALDKWFEGTKLIKISQGGKILLSQDKTWKFISVNATVTNFTLRGAETLCKHNCKVLKSTPFHGPFSQPVK